MGSTRNSCRLLLDVGGTFLKSAVADAAGQLLSGSEFSCPIRSEGSREEIEGSLAAAVARGAAFAAERGMELAGRIVERSGNGDADAGDDAAQDDQQDAVADGIEREERLPGRRNGGQQRL